MLFRSRRGVCLLGGAGLSKPLGGQWGQRVTCPRATHGRWLSLETHPGFRATRGIGVGHFRAPRARETHLQSSELPSGPFGVALCSHGFDQPWLLIGALIPVSGPCIPLGFSLMAKGPWSFPGQACLNAFPRRLCPLLPVAKEWAAPGQASFLMLSAVDGGAGSCGLQIGRAHV